MPSLDRKDIIAASARQEFEAARSEQDPKLVWSQSESASSEILISMKRTVADTCMMYQVAQMLLTGRNFLHEAIDKARPPPDYEMT